MSHPEEIRTLARQTIDEVTRRGWGKGSMTIYDDDDYFLDPALGYERPKDEAKANCKVCLAGGVGAVLYGDPDGAERDEAANDPFFNALADQVYPGWTEEITEGNYGDYPRYDSPIEVITDWNDLPGRKVEEVIAVLEAIAA